MLNITQPKLVDAAINEILDSAEMFGWRGARYDDHYTLWGQPAAELSTANMQRIFDLGKQRNPKFVWGFNYLVNAMPFAWPTGRDVGPPWKQGHKDASLLADPPNPRQGAMPEPYPEFAVACKNGGYIMNEEARGAVATRGLSRHWNIQQLRRACHVRGPPHAQPRRALWSHPLRPRRQERIRQHLPRPSAVRSAQPYLRPDPRRDGHAEIHHAIFGIHLWRWP